MEEYLLLGYIVGAFGLDGTMRVLSKTDFAKKRYMKGNTIFLYNQETQERKELTVEKFHKNGQFDMVKVKEINTKEEADALKSNEIQAIKTNDILAKDTYYFSDLVGCKVVNEDNVELGEVKEIEDIEKDWRSLLDGAIPYFKFPRINLEIDNVQDSFVNDLKNEEIQILATYMKCEWLNRAILTWEHIKPMYEEKDFSEANLIDKLNALLTREEKKARRLESLYYRSIDNNPFDYTTLAGF